MRIFTLKLMLLASLGLTGQSIVQDIERISHLSEVIRDTTETDEVISPALDTVIATLAYYATAPDTTKARGLFTGSKLLKFITGNQYLITYLTDNQLYDKINHHAVSSGYTYRNESFLQRSKFLRNPDPVSLFNEDGPFDFVFAREKAQIPATTLSTITQNAKASSDRLSGESYVANAIVGLTEFIAQRAQEELNYTFLTRLREELKKNNLNYLFPNTVKFLPDLDLLNYKSILPSIRQAFAKDLNELSFNLGNYLEEQSKNGYADPQLASILLIYQVLELGIRDISIANILGFTVSQLASNRIGLKSAINYELTDTNRIATAERRKIINALIRLDNSIEDLEAAVQDAGHKVDVTSSNLRLEMRRLNPTDSIRLKFDQVVRTNVIDTQPNLAGEWAKNAGGEALGILDKWLQGNEAIAYYEANPSFEYYDRLYSGNAKNLTSQELATAGVIGVEGLLARRDLLDSYRALKDSLTNFENDYAAIEQQLADRSGKYYPRDTIVALQNRIRAEEAAAKLEKKDTMAYALLLGLTMELPGLPQSTTDRKVIQQTKNLLAPIEERFLARVLRDSLPNSPEKIRQRSLNMTFKQIDKFPDLKTAIEKVDGNFKLLEAAMDGAIKQTAAPQATALGNVNTFSSVFGLSQELFFLLHRDTSGVDTGEYEKSESIAPIILDNNLNKLMRGITYQRLTQVPKFGNIDPRSLGSFLLDFSILIDQLNQPLSKEETKNVKVSKQIRTVQFVTDAIRNILGAKVLKKPGVDSTYSLAQSVKSFEKVPELSGQFQEMFRLSKTGQYRYAITNLMEVVKLFDPPLKATRRSLTRKRIKLDSLKRELAIVVTEKDSLSLEKKIERTRSAVNNLNKRDSLKQANDFFTITTFMADVAAADNSEAFVAALSSVALPKGSSAFKRNNSASLEIGAMAGLSIARESLVGNQSAGSASFKKDALVASVFMPVGIVYSNKLRSASRSPRRGTFSLFTSILDLGAVAAYRFGPEDSPVQALPDLKLSNVIAPGVHLLYQWPRSPFATGIGIQNGPNVRKFDPGTGEAAKDLRAYRILLNFAIDVPIFRLWGKN